MGTSRLRIAALALLLGLALAGWYYRANLDPRPKVQMADQPCPPPATLADEVKPVKFDWVELCRYTHENARLLVSNKTLQRLPGNTDVDVDPAIYKGYVLHKQ